jgi:phosphoglycolate phosphatase-like HAD superfamily hydrolase
VSYLKGLVFDVDGTLTNNLAMATRTFQEVLRQHTHRDFSDAEIRAAWGPTQRGQLRRILPTDPESCFAMWLAIYRRDWDRSAHAIGGLDATLDWLQKQGYRLAIVGGGDREAIDLTLELLEWRIAFDPIESGSAEGAVKPALLRNVLLSWQLRPDELAYVADTPDDMRDAQAVGMVPLGACWTDGYDARELVEAGAAAVFGSPADLQAWVAARSPLSSARGASAADGADQATRRDGSAI